MTIIKISSYLTNHYKIELSYETVDFIKLVTGVMYKNQYKATCLLLSISIPTGKRIRAKSGYTQQKSGSFLSFNISAFAFPSKSRENKQTSFLKRHKIFHVIRNLARSYSILNKLIIFRLLSFLFYLKEYFRNACKKCY